jgi:predicted aminopeptidase
LGLKKTQNYQKVYLKSRQNPIYTISASPKDRLVRKTWWFPVVGRMPYLGFFDLERARAKKADLVKNDLDVRLGMADAYSTLGWFKDPVTLNLLEGSTVRLVETILHEMTHTTIYLKEEGEFNESLANLVGKYGALLFLERNYGFSHPFAIEARKLIEDERMFSTFLSPLLQSLESLYGSPKSYNEKLEEREVVFSSALASFEQVKGSLQTDRFIFFGRSGLNNAYLLSVGLYHQHFHLFEAVFNKKGKSIKETIEFFKGMAREKGDILERTRLWLTQDGAEKVVS